MKLFMTGLLLLSFAALAQGPQNAPAMALPTSDEMMDYQNPLPNEGNGTSTWSDRQAQEERTFNKNVDYDQAERNADWDATEDDYVEDNDAAAESEE